MNDKFIIQKDLEQELQEIEKEFIKLNDRLNIIAQNIRYIFSKIKECENIQSINYYFDVLQKIQCSLAKIIYKEGFGLSDSLMYFTADFERLDDSDLRNYALKKIKSGEFNFGKRLM